MKFATADEIETEVFRITSVMPLPRGMDGEKLIEGYSTALRGFPLQAISEAVTGFLNGRFASDFSPKWCPMPPELAIMTRKCLVPRGPQTHGTLYKYRPPSSMVIESGVTRDRAKQLVDCGVAPRGSIWCPGPIGERSEFGTLYGPDDAWSEAKPVDHRAAEPPYKTRAAGLQSEFSGRKTLATGLTHSEFRKRAKAFPVGSIYVAALGNVYGPEVA